MVYAKDKNIILNDYVSGVGSLPMKFHLTGSLVLPGGIGVLIQSSALEACFSTGHESRAADRVCNTRAIHSYTLPLYILMSVEEGECLTFLHNMDVKFKGKALGCWRCFAGILLTATSPLSRH